MAKAKKEGQEEKDDFFNSKIFSNMKKSYGNMFAVPLDNVNDRERGIIRTKPSLDLALSGGLQMGQLVQIAGAPKAGKTTLAFEIAASFQKQYKDRKVYYYKVEGRLSSSLTEGIEFLDRERVVVVQSTKDKILSGINYLEIFEILMKENPESLHIIDSIAGITSDTEMSAGMSDQQMGDLPKILAKLCRRNSSVIGITNSLVISLNHIRANMNSKSTGFTGGNHWKHQLDTDIRVGIAFPDGKIVDSSGNQTGHNMSVEVFTTTLGPPKKKTVLPLIYGRGLPLIEDCMKIAVDCGIINQSGSWFEFNGEKIQGKSSLQEKIENDPEMKELLISSVDDLVYGS